MDSEEKTDLFENQGLTESAEADQPLPFRTHGRKHYVVNHHKGYADAENHDQPIDPTVMVDDGGYVDKTTQIAILQSAGANLDAFYRRTFPSIYHQEDEPDDQEEDLEPLAYGINRSRDNMDHMDIYRDLRRREDLYKREYDRALKEAQESKLAAQAAEIEKLKAGATASGGNTGL